MAAIFRSKDMRRNIVLPWLAVLAGCTSGAARSDTSDRDVTGTTATDGDTTGDSSDDGAGGPWVRKGCPAIYAQDLLPTFELEIAGDELAAIEKEWERADDDDIAEHPLIAFRYEDTVISDASVRLRGNSLHWHEQGKLQLEVSFNTYDPKGRFAGLKHVLFDAATYNRSFLRDRLALQIMRDVGLAAPCANNARVVLNGEYHGLFTNIEKVDSEFIERNFEDASGNLYKRGGPDDWKKKTNEDDPDTSDLERLTAAATVDELAAVMNLDQALLEWAAEAVIPDRDGAWGGGLNLYLYNDPKTGFNVIPWDLDDSFTRVDPDIDPVTWKKESAFHGRPWYDLALSDPAWLQRYVETVALVFAHGYQPDVLQRRIDVWSAQIAEAVAEDPYRPFTLEEHLAQVAEKREFVAARAAFLEQWVACRTAGDTDGDTDGEGACDGV
jgi:hypothetical protein